MADGLGVQPASWLPSRMVSEVPRLSRVLYNAADSKRHSMTKQPDPECARKGKHG